MVSHGAATLTATLPHPPGINRTYRSTTGGRWYKVDAARLWQDNAIVLMRAAGFTIQPPGPYWIALDLALHTMRLDIDAPVKLALDAVGTALAIDDRWVGELRVRKRFVKRREDQRLEVRATIHPLDSKEEFGVLAATRAHAK